MYNVYVIFRVHRLYMVNTMYRVYKNSNKK